MKKTSKKSKELTIDNEEAQRGQWVKLLDHCRMFHLQMVKDLQTSGEIEDAKDYTGGFAERFSK